MDAGASWSVWNSSLQTPLHLAAIAGNLCIVKLLILKGAKYDCEDGDGMTAILRASLEGHVDIVEHLLDQGAPLMCPDGKLTPTPLLCAVERCHHKTIEFLFSRGAPTDYQDMHWRTCLHVAAACSDFRTVEIILRNGGKSIINSKDSYGKTPLHYAVIRCQGGKIIQLLIESGANVLAVDFDERLPLHHAAEQGMLDNISILLQANPETINEVDNRSLTALHIAAAAARTEACRLLLEKGAEVDYRDDERLTPLFYVASVGCPLTVKVLLEYDADLEARDKNRKTPLISAAYFGRLEVFRTLLDSGADIAAETSSGWNALDVALDNNNLDITNEIIRHESWKTLLLNTKADGVSPLKKLIERVPCLAKVVLDKCIEHSTWVDTDKEYSVTYDFQLLSPPPDREKDKNGQRYFGPMEMLLHGREDLLRHPLTKKLMATKWRNVGVNFFYLGAFIYSLFLVDFSHFMFCVTGFNDKLRRNETEKSHMCSESMLYYQAITLAIFAIVNLLYEAYQLYTERLSYFEMANGFQVSTFVCTLIMLFPLEKNKFLVTELSWSAGMIGLLLAYLTFLLYLQTLFSTGIYVTMLFEVLKSLLKVLAMFSVLILGFALIFVLLMNGAKYFGCFGSRLNRRKKIGIKRDMTVNESPSDSLTNMQFTLADHGHRIDVISTELRAHRELLESIAAALHRTPSEPTNERNVRRQEGSEENILMKL
ncbi:transient receptor potential cation channel subfamily A member 1 isoform X2 [Nematostella vectensis]|uniref:transient receptor potential cation channel subfamily A member 1 isoform X2 n=1 Tax=Nematostella vectensis TaxID=45351 RepID=UPI002076E133|nr:transient receptor potential cation channel subfamily A member 1 isoform X2 [Nematostella vectensis]